MHRLPFRRMRRRLGPASVLLVTAGTLLALGTPVALGTYSPKITNTTNTASTGGYFTCTSAAIGNAATNAYFAYPLNEAGPSTAADISGNGRPGKYSLTGVTYNTPGPCPRDGARAVTLNGLTGYVSGPATSANPQVFSLEIWFKTTAGGGKLIGFGTSASGLSAQYDRHLFLSNGGSLTFGVYPNQVKTITSPATYLDGAWHDAIATLAPSTDPNPGMRLYVDGTLVASDPSTTSAEADTGYWRVGFDNLNGWGPNQPTNFYFTGSLAFASAYTYAMTPAQVSAHYRAGI